MNRAGVVYGFSLQEEDRCVYKEQELRRMVIFVVFHYYIGHE